MNLGSMQDLNPVYEHIRKELDLTEQLVALLSDEEQALIRQNPTDIEQIAEKKSQLINAFLKLKGERTARFKFQQVPVEEKQIAKWITSQNQDNLTNLWERLIAKLSLAQEINRTNGMMIARLSMMNRSALQHLMGQDPVKSVYGFNDNIRNTSKFNILG